MVQNAPDQNPTSTREVDFRRVGLQGLLDPGSNRECHFLGLAARIESGKRSNALFSAAMDRGLGFDVPGGEYREAPYISWET
jgi:hypothetical protein